MAIRKYQGPYHVFHVVGGWQIFESVGNPHRLWMELRPTKIYQHRRSAYARCTRLNKQSIETAWQAMTTIDETETCGQLSYARHYEAN